MTRAPTPSEPAIPAAAPSAPPLSAGVLALLAQFVLFIEDLMRLLEAVAGETLSPYLHRATGLARLLTELRAVADQLARVQQSGEAAHELEHPGSDE